MFCCTCVCFLFLCLYSPITIIAHYDRMEYIDGTQVQVCLTQANTFWPALFFLMTISLFFLMPLIVLMILYAVIARHLMADPGTSSSSDGCNQRARKQVVLMLGTVVLSFFICLLPFRVLTLWIIILPDDLISLGIEKYYILLYFCRIMFYLNSAVNPILYNLMSSKFRHGFGALCCLTSARSRRRRRRRNGDMMLLRHQGTITTTTCSQSSTRTHQQHNRGSPDLSWRSASMESRRATVDSRNGSIRRNVILRSSLLKRDYSFNNKGDSDVPESYV